MTDQLTERIMGGAIEIRQLFAGSRQGLYALNPHGMPFIV